MMHGKTKRDSIRAMDEDLLFALYQGCLKIIIPVCTLNDQENEVTPIITQ